MADEQNTDLQIASLDDIMQYREEHQNIIRRLYDLEQLPNKLAIRRSNGDIEYGWQIMVEPLFYIDGRVRVIKIEPAHVNHESPHDTLIITWRPCYITELMELNNRQ